MDILGTRVVRGRDWKWGNQDGGEGCVGTVVQISQDKKSPFTTQLVWIQWDCSGKANYRAGFDGKHDLRVLDTRNQGLRHVYVRCDGCNEDPVVGIRWRCLNCVNYDLCTKCYMKDIHDITHRFERIDKSRAKGVPVGPRQGSFKVEARGMFKGAKVIRGPDWEWKESDGTSEMEGEVTEITGWSDDTLNDAVRVAWKNGPKGNVYRLGSNGKVDVKCSKPAVGGSYYRDHLPPLIVQLKNSRNGFTTGDNVWVQQMTTEKLQELSAGHGGWNPDMEKFIGKVGVVQGFTINGDVVVEYPERRWRYNPAALTKIQQFKRGDEVVVKSDKKLVKELQEGHGGWNESMISIFGRTGKVLEVDGNGDILTLVEGDEWMLNPAAVTYVTEPDPSQSMGSSDESNEADPLGLFSLFRDFLLRQGSELGSSSLVHAAKTNQLSRVREILDTQPEVIDEIEGGHSALHLACHEGHSEIIKELLDRGANETVLDSQGYTAMHHSTYADRSGEALKLLLERGFDPNVQHSSNSSAPLHLAVKRDNEMAVQILTQCPECNINLQDEAGDTPLHHAIIGEKHSIFDMLLYNSRLSLTISNTRGFNYLQLAVLKGNKRAVEKLLAKAGDILNVAKSDGFTTLHIAAVNDHREIAKILLKQPGCDVNALTVENQSALNVASNEGYSTMVGILLDHGADVNSVDKDGDTALHIALAKESLLGTDLMSEMPGLQLLLGVHGHNRSYADVSRCLLSYGADVFKMNDKGETPLHRCQGSEVENLIREIAASGGTSQIRKVPSFGATNQSSNRQEVNSSSSANNTEGIQTDVESNRSSTSETNDRQEEVNMDVCDITDQDQAVQAEDEQGTQDEKEDQGAVNVAMDEDVNIVEKSVGGEPSYQLRREQGSLRLVHAAKTNQLSRVREILDAQPEVIDEIEGGHSALHSACHEGHCDIIRELLDRGAKRTALDSEGYTAMHHSTYGDRSGEAVKLLLERGFDPNVQHNNNSSTPLHLAVKRDNEMAVRMLAQCPQCNVNLQDVAGDTALHDAISTQKHSMVDVLLDNPRLSLTVCNRGGFNYLQCAVLKGNKRAVVKLLAKAGDILNVAKSDGFTTLHIAAINDHREIAKILLQQPGCDVNALGAQNQSALHVATDEGYSVMVEILLDHGADVNAVDNDGDTALHIALAKESMLGTDFMSEMPGLQLLLGLHGRSRSYADVSRCLLSYGADVFKMNRKGETPLQRCQGSEVEHIIREIAASGGASQIRKVPSFGATNQSSNRQEVNSSSPANKAEGTRTDLESNRPSTSETNNRQEEVKMDGGDITVQDQAVQAEDEQENQDEKEDQDDVNVAMEEDVNIVGNSVGGETSYQENIVLEVTNQVQELSDTEILNNSTDEDVTMAVNNEVTEHDHSLRPDLETQADGGEEHKDQAKEIEESETLPSCNEQKPQCQICEENEAVVAFKPCGHTVVCIECAPRLKRCLECKTTITGKGMRDGTPIIGVNSKSLVTKYQLLEGKLRKMEESIVCCICVERKKNIIFLCGHGTCHSCAEQLRICHICKKPIEKKIAMF